MSGRAIRHGKKQGQPVRYWLLGWTYWIGVRLFGGSRYNHTSRDQAKQ